MCGWTGHFGVKTYLITDEQDLDAQLPSCHYSFSGSGTDGGPYAMYNWE
jgi:hypothetical protein